jgi:holo-[acyl-carrier protein] synthase
MERAVEKHGERFAARILAEAELKEYQQSARPAHFLAKRFAAKEAAAKAFGTGFRDGLSMTHIIVTHDELGKPLLKFEGQAASFCENNGVGDSYISISDEKEHAVAFVTLLKN